MDSEPNQWLEFDSIGGDWTVDAAIPFLDSRPVEGKPFIALSGWGIYHRGASGYGGYLNIRLLHIDKSAYPKPSLAHLQATDNDIDDYA